ncbi:MAG: peptidoglycan-binding protein [Angelakisella sp.]
MPATPNLPVIPEYITVHLGKPNQNASNVQVSFADYIKNVASSEIYPTWPESALRANIYSQISFALNRIYTEHYRSKGYNFDITNSTQYDQAYQPGRDVFDNISTIVDELFNDYVVRRGNVEPYFTQFCNGTTVTCPGLSQWGTVDLAKKGYTPYEILTYYYGKSINIIKDAPVEKIMRSYPGFPLRLGMGGNDVRTLQLQLNRINKNFPTVLNVGKADGVFGPETEKSVRAFQKTFNLTQDGIVGKATWYKVKEIYNAVKQLSELSSEGIKLSEVTPPYPVGGVSKGDYGIGVQAVQYYISVIGYFNDAIPLINVDGIYGNATENAVRQFQSQYGLTVNGIVDAPTWAKLQEIYGGILASLPKDFYGERAKLYPGYFLKKGLENGDVRDLQTYLSSIRGLYSSIPPLKVTGYFGDQTEAAVRAFQKLFNIPVSGTVGPATWVKLAAEYDRYKGLA